MSNNNNQLSDQSTLESTSIVADEGLAEDLLPAADPLHALLRVDTTELPPIASFDEVLGASVIDAARQNGWTGPTPVQGMCLPYTVKGRDLAGFAQTGTGKTGVFILTIAERLTRGIDGVLPTQSKTQGSVVKPDVIVLTPTRELAMQIDDDAKKVLGLLGIKSMPVFGGVDIEKQAADLKKNPRILVATPGRLKDFTQRRLIDLSTVSVFICDEADRMFDMGFIDDVEFFLDKIPENAQKLLFSATTNDNVKELAFEYLNQPAYVSVTPETITPEKIEQHAVLCDSSNKLKVILGLFAEHQPECAIVFTNTKMVAEWLHFKLNGNGIQADLITGDLPQSKRIALIKRIKEGKLKALIATDVASRGLHISKVSHVYNFDVPDDPANYVHRIGRTARAGASGKSYTLVCDDYGANMAAVNELLGTTISPKATWFDESYLKIVDQTGNPYEVDGPLYRSPKDRDDKRKGASSHAGRKFKDQKPSGQSRDDRPVTKSQPKKFNDRGPKNRPHRDSYDARKSHPTSHGDQKLVVAGTSSTGGLMGWIARIWRSLFRK